MSKPPSSSPPPPPADKPHTSRRGALRAKNLKIAATFLVQGDPTPRRCTVSDVSATGAQLLTTQELAHNTLILLEFTLPKGPRIKGRARVMRCKVSDDGHQVIGVAFAISVEDELAVAQWVFDHV